MSIFSSKIYLKSLPTSNQVGHLINMIRTGSNIFSLYGVLSDKVDVKAINAAILYVKL